MSIKKAKGPVSKDAETVRKHLKLEETTTKVDVLNLSPFLEMVSTSILKITEMAEVYK